MSEALGVLRERARRGRGAGETAKAAHEIGRALTQGGSPVRAPGIQVEGIDHVALLVRDVPRSVAWYRDVLGLNRLHEATWGDVPAIVAGGATAVALFPARTERPPGRLTPAPPRSNTPAMQHLAFRSSRAHFLAAQETLRSLGIPFEFQDHDIAHSIYFEDPDGHALEITTYELAPGASETIEVLSSDGDVRVERIVSRGHASPPGFWYDQDEAEHVVLVRGAARLEFEGGRTLELRSGDSVDLAAHERHRVAWTDPDQDTVWIAIFRRPSAR